MSEVTDEEQAAMAIKLSDNVRQLIREELKAALEDYGFVSGLPIHNLGQHLTLSFVFREAVRSVIREQMNKP